jgi:hypothetical protein
MKDAEISFLYLHLIFNILAYTQRVRHCNHIEYRYRTDAVKTPPLCHRIGYVRLGVGHVRLYHSLKPLVAKQMGWGYNRKDSRYSVSYTGTKSACDY